MLATRPRERSLFSSALAIQALGAALAYGSQLVLARTLGTDGFGAYSAAVSSCLIISMLATLGTPAASMRHVPKLLRANDALAAARHLSTVLTICTTSGTVVALTTAAVGASLFDLPVTSSCAIFILVLAGTLVSFGSDSGRAVGRHVTTYGAAIVMRPAIIAVGVMTLATSTTVEPPVALAVSGLAGVACFTVQAHSIRSAIAPQRLRIARFDHRWLTDGLPYLTSGLLALLLTQIDVIVVALLLTPHEAGVYAAGSRLAASVALATVAVNTVLAPRIGGLSLPRDRKAVRTHVRSAARWGFAGSLLIAIPLVALGPLVLKWFGDDFTRAIVPLTVLAVANVARAALGPVGVLLMYSDHRAAALCLSAFGVTVATLGVTVGAVSFGVTGAAVGVAVALVGAGLAGVPLSIRRTGVSPTVW